MLHQQHLRLIFQYVKVSCIPQHLIPFSMTHQHLRLIFQYVKVTCIPQHLFYSAHIGYKYKLWYLGQASKWHPHVSHPSWDMSQFSDKCLERVQEHKFQPEQVTGVCHLDPDQGAANVWKEITWFKTELAKTCKMEEYYFIRVYN